MTEVSLLVIWYESLASLIDRSAFDFSSETAIASIRAFALTFFAFGSAVT